MHSSISRMSGLRHKLRVSIGCAICVSKARCPTSFGAAQHSFEAQILIHVGPVYAATSSRQLPMSSLLRPCVPEPGIPPERRDDLAAVSQGDDEVALRARNVRYLQRLLVNRQNAHARLSTAVPDHARRCSESRSPREARSRHCMRPLVSKPNLDRLASMIAMDVGRLVPVATPQEESVPLPSHNCWHVRSRFAARAGP